MSYALNHCRCEEYEYRARSAELQLEHVTKILFAREDFKPQPPSLLCNMDHVIILERQANGELKISNHSIDFVRKMITKEQQ